MREQRLRDVQAAKLALRVAAYGLGVDPDLIDNSKKGSPEQTLLRHLAMYLASVGFSMTYARIALAFERDRSTVSYACRRVEEMRDAPDFDRWIEQLETVLREAPAPASFPQEGR